MKKYSLLAIFLFFSTNTSAVEFEHSVGFGLQYGGILGWQGAVVKDEHRGRIAFGLAGISLGYDYLISPNMSIGVQTGATVPVIGTGINFNYYFDEGYSKGWMFGVDLVHGDYFNINGGIDEFTEEDAETVAFFSVGYSF